MCRGALTCFRGTTKGKSRKKGVFPAQPATSVVSKQGSKKPKTTLSLTAAYILEKLHHCCFFDDEVQPSIFFLTLHDAMLHILEKHPESAHRKSDYYDKVAALTLEFSLCVCVCSGP